MCKSSSLKRSVDLNKLKPIPCDCGGMLEVKYSEKFDSFFYGCNRWPSCNCTVGMYSNGKPRGTPANKETREWRARAQKSLEAVYGKNDIYGTFHKKEVRKVICSKWLSAQLEIEDWVRNCRIENFRIDECQRVIEVCKDVTWDFIDKWHFNSQIYESRNERIAIV